MSSYFTVKNCVRVMLFIFVLAVPVVLVFAQAQTDQPLVPCEGTLGDKGCTAKMLTMLFMNIINFLIVLAAILGTLMLVFSGISMVTANGNKGKIEHSKETFKNVVIGLVFVLAAWTIVDTFLKIMVGETLLGDKWYNLNDAPNTPLTERREESVDGRAITPSTAAGQQAQQNNQGATDGSAGAVSNPARDGMLSADAGARLRAAGISTQSGVNLAGVSEARVNQAIALAEACNSANGGSPGENKCGVQISSGFRSGTGQSNHGTGDALDISGRSSMFTNWMQNQPGANTPTFKDPKTGEQYYGTATSNGTCTYHPNESGGGMHWHCSSTGR